MRSRRRVGHRQAMPTLNPKARRDGLVVQALPDETLVYDLKRHRAHCLNRTAALIWQHCDGRTTVAGLASLLNESARLPADEAVVWMGLEGLAKAHLLHEKPVPPEEAGRYTRREMLRRLGVAGGLALLLPAVQSIVAPEVVQAASGVTSAACFQNPNANAGKCCIDVNPRKLCRKVLWWGFCTGNPC